MFKFRRFGKSSYWWNRLDWEYGECNNRKITSTSSPLDATTCWMSYGKTEVPEEDLIEFMKIALCDAALKDLNAAMAKIEEVWQSSLQVTCEFPSLARPHKALCVRHALSDIVSSDRNPCDGMYVYVAALEYEATGNLRHMNTLALTQLLRVIAALRT